MTEEEWDSVIHVHLKGHFVPTRTPPSTGASRPKAGEEVTAAVVNTSSTSGLLGNPGQTNYGAAKTGIATFSVIAAQELARYGVRVQRHRPGGPHPDDGDTRRGGRRRRRQIPARSTCGTRPTSRRWSRSLGHRGLPDLREGLLRPGRDGAPVPAVDHGRHDRPQRPVDRRRAGDGDGQARGSPLQRDLSDAGGELPSVSPRGAVPCIASSFDMSPSTRILPAMKADMAACELPSTRRALAVS